MAMPVFLDLDHTLRLHLSLIEHYGGANGIRDESHPARKKAGAAA